MVRRVLFAGLVILVIFCGGIAASCTASTCVASCEQRGYTTGYCNGGHSCTCIFDSHSRRVTRSGCVYVECSAQCRSMGRHNGFCRSGVCTCEGSGPPEACVYAECSAQCRGRGRSNGYCRSGVCECNYN